jgi:RNA polymerase sigma-70 factor (ECF subfamily)
MGQIKKENVFALAVQRYSDAVYRAAMHNCSCSADAEDAVQDVFEKLLRYDGTFENEEHLKAWLLRVTINRCHDLARAAYQKDSELSEDLPAPEDADGSLLDAVRSLPENYRNVIYLHYYEGYTAAEIGQMLGTPANTVLTWMRRARAQLHTMLKEEIEDEVV